MLAKSSPKAGHIQREPVASGLHFSCRGRPVGRCRCLGLSCTMGQKVTEGLGTTRHSETFISNTSLNKWGNVQDYIVHL